MGDILRHLIAGAIILTIGLILGYRPEAGIPGVIGAFLLLFAIGFGMGWIFIVLGLLIRTPMTVMTFGFTFLFPLVFASNLMVDPATMPAWLRVFVDLNPISGNGDGHAGPDGRHGYAKGCRGRAYRAGGSYARRSPR